MAKKLNIPLTDAEINRAHEIDQACDFLRTYYPGFWDRMDEKDIIHLMVLGQTLFKLNPQILEATNQLRRLPAQ